MSADVAARDPHVVSLRVEVAGRNRRAAVAVINDGQLSYLVTLVLEREPRGWRVVDTAGS